MTEFPHSTLQIRPVASRSEKDRVLIFDTTLRDGEQSPGASMNIEEKIRSPAILDEMGVDIIEAGFPVASRGRFRGRVGDRQASSERCGARAWRAPIRRTSTARARPLPQAKRGRIHTFIGTSPMHRQYQLQMSAEQVYEAVVSSVNARAQSHTDDVEWSAMDATRTEARLLVPRASRPRSRPARPPSTSPTRWATPCRTNSYEHHHDAARARARRGQGDRVSTHCHNDLGLAVANSLAGVKSGRAPGRVHHQRARRAGGQRGAGRGRDGAQDAQRRHALLDEASTPR